MFLTFLYSSSSLPGSSPSCPGGCAISNCRACYYSYNDLPSPQLPSSCPQQCSVTNEKADECCMAKWGQCMYRAYLKLYQSVSVTCYHKFNILYKYRSYLMKGMIRHFVVGLINVLNLDLGLDLDHCA